MKYGRKMINTRKGKDILKSQSYRCAICDEPNHVLYVDHDYITKDIRGALCPRCNTGLGYFKESPALLAKARSYLVMHDSIWSFCEPSS